MTSAISGVYLVQCGHFADKGSGFFRCGPPRFFVQKPPNFWNVWCDCMDKGVWASVEILRTRGRVQFFAILCGRLLWTAPYQFANKYKVR